MRVCGAFMHACGACMRCVWCVVHACVRCLVQASCNRALCVWCWWISGDAAWEMWMMHACVRACMRACMHACVLCVHACCVCMHAYMCDTVCVLCMLCMRVTGYNARAAGAAAWLPRVPLWLPLRILWCHTVQLHTGAQPHTVRLSPQHASPWPLHTQPQGRHPSWNLQRSPRHDQLCQPHSTRQLQEGQFIAMLLLASFSKCASVV